jgi:hypothetical protein
MTEESISGRVRARCVWWLSGQCKGGATCTCLPPPRQEPGAGPAHEHISPPQPPADDAATDR